MDFKQRTWEIFATLITDFYNSLCMQNVGAQVIDYFITNRKDQGWFLVHHGALRILGGYWQVGCYHADWLYAHSCVGSLVCEDLWTSRFQRWNPAAESTLQVAHSLLNINIGMYVRPNYPEQISRNINKKGFDMIYGAFAKIIKNKSSKTTRNIWISWDFGWFYQEIWWLIEDSASSERWP